MIIPSSTVIVISFFKFRQSHLQINKVMRSCRYTSISVIDSLISSRSHRSFSAALLKLLCRVRFVEKVPTAEEDQETMEIHQFESLHQLHCWFADNYYYTNCGCCCWWLMMCSCYHQKTKTDKAISTVKSSSSTLRLQRRHGLNKSQSAGRHCIYVHYNYPLFPPPSHPNRCFAGCSWQLHYYLSNAKWVAVVVVVLPLQLISTHPTQWYY